MRRIMAEIEWPLEKDARISSWRLIVAYHPEGYGSSRGELTQSVELLRRLAEALALRGNFSFAAVCECPGVSVHVRSLWEAMLAHWRRWSVLARWQ
jgi:hypothetical protein